MKITRRFLTPNPIQSVTAIRQNPVGQNPPQSFIRIGQKLWIFIWALRCQNRLSYKIMTLIVCDFQNSRGGQLSCMYIHKYNKPKFEGWGSYLGAET